MRLLRVVAIVTTIAIPAVAVTTIDAAAHDHSPSVTPKTSIPGDRDGAVHRDDMNQIRIDMNAVRAQALRKLSVDAVPTPAQRERASRDLVRAVLNLPEYVRPVPGPVTQWYGSHPGIDIAPGYGTPIGAAHAGVVTFVGLDDGYGMHVEVLQVDGFVTTYSHMSGYTVNVGQLVRAGQQLGMVGSTGWSTGPHLHFEVHLPDGSRTDPAAWLTAHGVVV
jgi:murein DD-endopeptidase MepM/ murein hydrolase activator NlpD